MPTTSCSRRLTPRDVAHAALTKVLPANAALGAYSLAETAQDVTVRAAQILAHTRQRTKRLQKFVEIVDANQITPFTTYARDNWPLQAGEFYAEAYSLWLTEPSFVQANYRPIFDFFNNGDYVK